MLLAIRSRPSLRCRNLNTLMMSRQEVELTRKMQQLPSQDALKAFSEYQQEFTPTPELYTDALSTMFRISDFSKASVLWNEMKESGVKPITSTYNVMLQMYNKSREYEKAISLFFEMRNKGAAQDSLSYDQAIIAHYQQDQLDKVLARYEEMKTFGFVPANSTIETANAAFLKLNSIRAVKE